MDIQQIYAAAGGRFRRRRIAKFRRSFAVTAQTTVVDLGGAAATWGVAVWGGRGARPQVVLVNIDPGCPRGELNSVVADALACPFSDGAFDLVFSNSLVEHLGTQQRQRAFATEVRRLCREGYFVQTPNKWFPIEPHYLAPFVQFIPKRLRPLVIRWATPWGWLTQPSRERCAEVCQEIRLLGAKEMRQLFPDAKIVRERFLGLTKSLIALWQPDRSTRSLDLGGDE